MNKQRKVVITVTYNEMGIIIDTKAEEVAQPNLQPTCKQLATDIISRQAAIDLFPNDVLEWDTLDGYIAPHVARRLIEDLPSAQPERLTDDDFETIRIHLNAQKEKLCNQRRWEEAEEYQRIIDRIAGQI